MLNLDLNCRGSNARRYLRAVLSVVLVVACVPVSTPLVTAQRSSRSDAPRERKVESTVTPPRHAKQAAESLDETARAMTAACRERELDPQGSVPIDVLQARPSLPLAHGAVVAGVARAERLLPVAKLLAAESLTELARETGVNRVALREGLRRVRR
ncbi:MAG: hypothetical protein LC742_12395, partial [Acidobacteria bacterium]|nr:hypothetical protein [Acidobacteriota bacterium]